LTVIHPEPDASAIAASKFPESEYDSTLYFRQKDVSYAA
jgi:hypothetical protein